MLMDWVVLGKENVKLKEFLILIKEDWDLILDIKDMYK